MQNNKLCVDVYNFLTNDHEVVGDLRLTEIGGFVKHHKLKKETRKGAYWQCKIADVPVNIIKLSYEDRYYMFDELKLAKIYLAQSGDNYVHEDYDIYKEDTVTIFLGGYYNETRYIVHTAEILRFFDFTNSEAKAIIDRSNKAAKDNYKLYNEIRISVGHIGKMDCIEF